MSEFLRTFAAKSQTMDHDKWQWQEPGTAWRGVGLYHITLTVTSRQPLLGTLVIPNNDPAQARVDVSPFGRTLTTIRYIDMNPQRLATKRLKPGFFRVQDNIEIAGRIYCGVGNSDLLDAQHYMPVHVRRTMIEEAIHGDDKRLNEYMDSCIAAAQKGAVMVSPFIHEKEREVLYSVLAEGGKVIYLADYGFGEYYKPSDGIFDAVANKQVLILSPWPYDPKKRHISRAECVALNEMAEEICGLSSLTPESDSGK